MSAPTPAFPVPVVRLIISDELGRVLLVRRSGSEYSPGAWCLPGGKVDYGDTVEEAAARELSEETSLQATGLRFLFYQDSLPLEPGGMHCLNMYFEAEVEGVVKLNEESSQFAWVGPGELSGYQVTFRNDEGLTRFWRDKELHPGSASA